jgi:hypothetical protein
VVLALFMRGLEVHTLKVEMDGGHQLALQIPVMVAALLVLGLGLVVQA